MLVRFDPVAEVLTPVEAVPKVEVKAEVSVWLVKLGVEFEETEPFKLKLLKPAVPDVEVPPQPYILISMDERLLNPELGKVIDVLVFVKSVPIWFNVLENPPTLVYIPYLIGPVPEAPKAKFNVELFKFKI